MSEQSEDETVRPPAAGEPAEGTAGAGGKPAVQVVDGTVQQFLDGVRAALADLPPGEVDEILDDVRAHLADLADELGESPDRDALSARLGTPAAYAAELRAAAGYPPPPAPVSSPAQSLLAPRLALVGLVGSTILIPLGLLGRSPTAMALGAATALLALPALIREGPRMTAVAELPELRGPLAQLARVGKGFPGDLQAAWWVLRALIAAVLFLATFGYPELPVVVLLTALAAPVSVWLGRRSKRDRRWLWLVVPLNALAVAVVGLLGPGWTSSPEVASAESSYPYPTGLVQDGEPVRDIRPVDADGNPLTGVYLFDQDGRPITIEDFGCEGYYDEDASSDGLSVAPVPSFPRGTWEYDPNTGQCILVPPAPLVVAVPSVTVTPTAPTGVAPTQLVPTAVPPVSAEPGAQLPPTASQVPVVPPTPAIVCNISEADEDGKREAKLKVDHPDTTSFIVNLGGSIVTSVTGLRVWREFHTSSEATASYSPPTAPATTQTSKQPSVHSPTLSEHAFPQAKKQSAPARSPSTTTCRGKSSPHSAR